MPLIAGTPAADTLAGGSGADTLDGGDGADQLTDGVGGDDLLLGGAGNDHLRISRAEGSSTVVLDGGLGDEYMSLSTVQSTGPGRITATVRGGEGADYLSIFGQVGATVDMGPGADGVSVSLPNTGVTVTLGAGADRLTLEANVVGPAGSLTVTDFQPGAAGDRFDIPTLRFWLTNYDESNPFGSGHMQLAQVGADAVLRVDLNGGGDAYVDLVRFSNVQASLFTAFNLFDFDPSGAQPAGQVITGKTTFINGGDNELRGTAGSDTINALGLPDTIRGGAGNDLIDGGTGDDEIHGEAGNDTVSGGEGNDRITAGQRDLVRGQAGNDILTTDTGFDATSGMTLDGGAGDDTIRFWLNPGQAGVGFGGDGRDAVRVMGYGAVTVDGGAGDDTFTVSNNSLATITLTLGAGVDELWIDGDAAGTAQAVVTDFAAGAGGDRLRLFDYLQQLNRFDYVKMAPTWSPGVNPFGAGLIRLVASGSSTIVQVKAGDQWLDTFTLQNVSPSALTSANFDGYSPDGYRLEAANVVGTSNAESIAGGAGADMIQGGAGGDTVQSGLSNDTLDGGDGNDFLLPGDGDDVVHGGAGEDTIADSFADYEAFFGGAGNDSLGFLRTDGSRGGHVLLDGGDGNDTLGGGGSFPTGWFTAEIYGGAGNDVAGLAYMSRAVVDMGPGNDRFVLGTGWMGDLSITLGAGADYLVVDGAWASKGVAVIQDFNPAEDFLLVFGLYPDDGGLSAAFRGAQGTLRFVQNGADALLQINLFTTTDEWMTALRFVGVDARAISSVSTVPVDVGPINAGPDLPPPPPQQTFFSALHVGSQAPDTITGGTGTDSITGGDGASYLRGAEGNDRVVGGRDFDDINGNQGNDTASGGPGDDWVVGGKDSDSLAGDRGADLVYGNLGNDTCYGGEGNDIVRGGQDNDIVFGGAGDDFVSGDRGADTMIGDGGADIFHSFGETGIDRVIDFSLVEGDRVQLDSGTQYTVAQVGADTVISMTGGGQMILVGVQLSSLPTGWIFGA